MSLVLEYSWWWVLLVLVLAILYSSILYYKNKANSEMPQWLIISLAVFRFVVVFLIAFLLLSPLINTTIKKTEKPIVVIAQDNSQSILANKDSAFYKGTYKQNVNELVAQLSEKYDVRLLLFSDRVSNISSANDFAYNNKQTDISQVIEDINTRYSNSNLGAIIMATDGLYNLGTNPLYVSEKIKAPIYCVALGDTTIKKDLIVKQVEHNKIAFLGNKFPLNVVINALKLKGKEAVITVNQGKEVLFSQKTTVTSDAYTTSIPLFITAKEKGLQHFKVRVSPIEGEATTVNNTKDVYVEVIDSRQKILLLYNAPHPDVAAIKQSIEANESCELEVFSADAFIKNTDAYNLIILHGVPNGKMKDEVKNANVPYWLITGAGTLAGIDLSVQTFSGKMNETEAAIEKNFSLFTVTEEFKKGLRSFPAIYSPYVNTIIDNVGDAFLYQKIGMIETQLPLMYFNSNNEVKRAVFMGEGLWRWRMYEFAKNENTLVFDEFISKTVQYLSVKQDKSFFRLSGASTFNENEPVLFYAELYNDSYELINEPDINVVITNSENKKFNYVFGKTSNAYRLDAGMLPVGEYTLEAKAVVGSKLHTQRAKFHVTPLQVELLNTAADHRLLYNIAQKNNGGIVYPNELNKLSEKLAGREEIKPVIYSQNTTSDLINNKWLFLLVILLLTAEWLVRKRNGLV